jgi:TP901 family phage tail tape measure protein
VPLSVGSLVGYLTLNSTRFDRGITSAQRSLDLTGKSADKLGLSVKASETALAGAGREADLAASRNSKLRAAQLTVVAAQERYNALIEQGDASTQKLATSQASLIRANDRLRIAQANALPALKANTDAAASSTAVLGTRLATTAVSVGKMAVGFAAFSAAFKAVEMVKAANQFQQSMLLIETQAGATRAEVEKLTPAVLALSGEVATAPDQLATSLYHVESVGLRGAAALEVVRVAAMGAKVGLADVEETTNALTSSVASGISGVQSMTQAMGALTTIVGSGDMKMSDLNEALGGGILSVVKAYGLSLTDVGAALATFGDNNIRGADAATALRMAVMALSKPATEGKKTIESLGLTMTTLRDDMQQGGLNQAVLDLQKHLNDAGITGAKVGGVLTEAFGKRAGIGLAVLMNQVGRFETKINDIQVGANGFGADWEATTKTAAFGFQKLEATVQSVAISIYGKVGPALGEAAGWLGTKLPAAVHTLQDVLGPLEHEVAFVMVPAWHLFAGTVGAAESALVGIAHVLRDHKTIVTAVGTAVGGMWLAYKGYQVATLGVRAVGSALETLALKAMYAKDAVAGAATGLSVGNLAVAGIGIVLGVATLAWAKHAAAVAASKQRVDDFTASIKEDSDAIGINTSKLAAATLQKEGALDAANKLGLSLVDVTAATLGGAAATERINAAYADFKRRSDDNWHAMNFGTTAQRAAATAADVAGGALSKEQTAWDILRNSIGQTTGEIHSAVVAAQNIANASFRAGDTLGAWNSGLKAITTALNSTTTAMTDQQDEAQKLSAVIATLSGNYNAGALAQLAYQDGLAAIKDQIAQQKDAYKDAGTSLSQNTAEGRKNLEWLHQQIDGLNGVADAQLKAGVASKDVASKMKANEDALLAAATAAGLDEKAVKKLLDQYAVDPGVLVLKADPTPAVTAVNKVKTVLASFQQLAKANPEVTVDGQPAIDEIARMKAALASWVLATKRASGKIIGGIGMNAAGTDNWHGGLTWVGEGGPELLDLPAGSRIIDNKRSTKIAAEHAASTTGGHGAAQMVEFTWAPTINNPVPEPASTTKAQELRRAIDALSGLNR